MTIARSRKTSDVERELEAKALRTQILDLAGRYAQIAHARPPFEPGRSPIPASGKVYGEPELRMLVDPAPDFWLMTWAVSNDAFEASLARAFKARYAPPAIPGRPPISWRCRLRPALSSATRRCGRGTRLGHSALRPFRRRST